MSKKSVLIVDDELDILENLEVMLERSGFNVLMAHGGREGIQKASEGSPDIVLLDVMMPDLDGFQVCAQLKSSGSTKNIPIILLTAVNDIDQKVKGLEAGADDFVTKPFNDIELLARVKAFLRTKQLRDELEKSYAKLKSLESLKNSLVNMVVHDLKSPLTSVVGGIRLFLMNNLETPRVEKVELQLLENAQKASEKIMMLINKMLDISRMEEEKFPLNLSEVDLSEVIQEAISVSEPLAKEKEIKLSADVPPRFKENIDRDLIFRVIVNLISNGIKFTDPKGTVVVCLEAQDGVPFYRVRVKDSGRGIPKENLEKIFEKFFRVNGSLKKEKGHGLGLTFCDLAIRNHNGKIWAESEPGQGSEFIFELPKKKG